uniref:Uncharacterized protein n=1 Tax=uncultured organism TaxID=155900 RepID=A0A7L9QCL9_9ZZZZ|nr:hypothetical protein [uncultured organism]
MTNNDESKARTVGIALLSGLLSSLLNAFLLMVLLGALHSHITAVPALGFTVTWLALLAAKLVLK